jgi:tRNA (guanine37-N1)-methyltransferase
MTTFTVIPLFPEMFSSPLGHSILKKAREKGMISVQLVDLREYTTDRHRTADDSPYGGGQGMVMKPEPLVKAIEDVRGKLDKPRVVLLTPQGKVFDQSAAKRLAKEKNLVLICGRYEGMDERIKEFVDDELSVGDYTLSGGEIAAMVVIDAVTRLIPGVLGNSQSAEEESFTNGLLEYPQYTRPEEFRGMKVPDVLLSGDHERIKNWRREMSLKSTRERRPDLFRKAQLTPEERKRFSESPSRIYVALLHYPVYDKNGQVVTSAITNMDVHDIARSAKTYGIRGFYVVTPVKALQKLVLKIMTHWERGYGAQYNETRREALSLLRLKDTLDDVMVDLERECESKPVVVVTTARSGERRTSFTEMREMLKREKRPLLLLFGTGWGLAETVLAQSDYILEAVQGGTDYNHLSVRSAAAIILDRLLGQG